MQREILTEGMLAGKQEQGWNRVHSLGKKRNSEGNLRFHDKEVRKQIWALGKTCNRNRGRKKILTAGENNQELARQGRTKAHESWGMKDE